VLALIDESTPASVRGVHYVISSAVVLDSTEIATSRARVMEITAGRKRPFHWSKEGVQKRGAMVCCFGDVCLAMFTVVHFPVQARRQNVAREAALNVLLEVLTEHGVGEVWIESRGVQDEADHRTILDAKHAGLVPSGFSYSFYGKAEPLLWLPDAAAGAYGDAELGKGTEHLLTIEKTVSAVEVRHVGF
jgi:hypothetical protein